MIIEDFISFIQFLFKIQRKNGKNPTHMRAKLILHRRE